MSLSQLSIGGDSSRLALSQLLVAGHDVATAAAVVPSEVSTGVFGIRSTDAPGASKVFYTITRSVAGSDAPTIFLSADDVNLGKHIVLTILRPSTLTGPFTLNLDATTDNGFLTNKAALMRSSGAPQTNLAYTFPETSGGPIVIELLPTGAGVWVYRTTQGFALHA